MQKKKRRGRTKRRRGRKWPLLFLLLLALVLACGGIYNLNRQAKSKSAATVDASGRPAIDVQLLTPNKYSRPQIALKEINGIVIHYTANPGATAKQNRDYFEGLAESHETHASSHFVIGLDGEIIQCIPSSEISYASNDRNSDTLSIECCHPDESGKFNEETYESAVNLTAWLCRNFGVDVSNVIRHYDITGKICPKYFVDHEDAWEQFKTDVSEKIAEENEPRDAKEA
jgi:N-acetylmuramoyl-L-alanine amidase